MLVIGGPRNLFESLIVEAARAEQACNSRSAGDVVACASEGASMTESLAVDRALCVLAEGRTDVIDFVQMVKESEERKGFRTSTVPAQPKFYGKGGTVVM